MQNKKAKHNPPAGASLVECQTPSSSTSDDSSEASPRRSFRKKSEQKRRVLVNQYFDEVVTLLTMMGEKTASKKVDKATTLMEAATFVKMYFDLASVNVAPPPLPPFTPATVPSAGAGERGARPTATAGRRREEPKSAPPTPRSGDVLQAGEVLHFLLNAMDAFLMVVLESGRVLYCTELVTSLLGHMQSRLVGQSIFDYVPEQEVPLLRGLFQPLVGGEEGDPPVEVRGCPVVSYPCRKLQCSLKMYGGETGLFPQYLLFQCLSYLRVWKKASSLDPSNLDDTEVQASRDSNSWSCILLVAKLPTNPSVVDLPISTNEVNFQFDMRVSREGKIIDIEKQATLVLGYLPGELIGVSFFDYIDPHQLPHLAESIVVIMNKGLGTTTPSRLRSKSGRYLWFISKGYLSYNPWNHKPDHILFSARILGCDQVLSEQKFYRDLNLVPDLSSTEEWYNPGPLPQSKLSSPGCDTSSDPRLSSTELPPRPHLPPPLPLPLGASPLYSSYADGILIEGGDNALQDMRRELSLKNQELFDLQCRLLEQQQMMEKERNQFYRITRQVMQCISYPLDMEPEMAAGGGSGSEMLLGLTFEPTPPGRMTAMQGFGQEFGYVAAADPGISAGSHQLAGNAPRTALREAATLFYKQNNQPTMFSPSVSAEMLSPSTSLPPQKQQNGSYLVPPRAM